MALKYKRFQLVNSTEPVLEEPCLENKFCVARFFRLLPKSIFIGPHGGPLSSAWMLDEGVTDPDMVDAILAMAEPIQVQGTPKDLPQQQFRDLAQQRRQEQRLAQEERAKHDPMLAVYPKLKVKGWPTPSEVANSQSQFEKMLNHTGVRAQRVAHAAAEKRMRVRATPMVLLSNVAVAFKKAMQRELSMESCALAQELASILQRVYLYEVPERGQTRMPMQKAVSVWIDRLVQRINNLGPAAPHAAIAGKMESDSDVRIMYWGNNGFPLGYFEQMTDRGGNTLGQAIMYYLQALRECSESKNQVLQWLYTTTNLPTVLVEIQATVIRISLLVRQDCVVVEELSTFTCNTQLDNIRRTAAAIQGLIAAFQQIMKDYDAALKRFNANQTAAPAAPSFKLIWVPATLPQRFPGCNFIPLAGTNRSFIKVAANNMRSIVKYVSVSPDRTGSSSSSNLDQTGSSSISSHDAAAPLFVQVQRAWSLTGAAPSVLNWWRENDDFWGVELDYKDPSQGWHPLDKLEPCPEQESSARAATGASDADEDMKGHNEGINEGLDEDGSAGPMDAGAPQASADQEVARLSVGEWAKVNDLVEALLTKGHAACLGSEQKKTVHGDIRKPNILARVDGGKVLEVLATDFEWAGIHGETTYPATMNCCIKWARTAGPMQVMRQQHDTELWENQWAFTYAHQDRRQPSWFEHPSCNL